MANAVCCAGFARWWCRAATFVTACLVGIAIDEGRAATRTDLIEISQINSTPVSTLASRFDSRFMHLPISPILQPPRAPLASRFTPASDAIEGIASTYNPGDPSDLSSGGQELASGEKYDREGWSAAIRIDLRDKFGGVHFGKDYRPTYALVEEADKGLIVKINDVGPLRPDRIIDLDIRAMRYFDPTLQLGVIQNVRVTPLVGTDMVLGPLKNNLLTNFAGWFT